MKIKLLNTRLFRYFSRLIYGKNPGNMSASEKSKIVLENNLRWEDDGGPVVERGNLIDRTNPDLVRK